MPQSLSRILIHLVFSTKNRERVLTPAVRTELHPYLAGTLDNLECPSLQVGGTEDHVHLFFGLSRTRTIADVVEMVKTSSSKWIKTKAADLWSSIGSRATAHFPSASPMQIRSWHIFAIRPSITRR